MKKIMAGAVMALLLFGCDRADPRLVTAQDAVKARLRDPESARFRNVVVSFDGAHICGEVNAKNGMGGYVGFTRFIYGNGSVSMREDGLSDRSEAYNRLFDGSWSSDC